MLPFEVNYENPIIKSIPQDISSYIFLVLILLLCYLFSACTYEAVSIISIFAHLDLHASKILKYYSFLTLDLTGHIWIDVPYALNYILFDAINLCMTVQLYLSVMSSFIGRRVIPK